MGYKFSRTVIDKLRTKHNLTQKEVMECFANGEGIYLIDRREEHRTDPPTKWFMAPTNHGRMLKICFMLVEGDIVVKTAFEANKSVHLETYIRLADLPTCWPEEE